MTSSKDNQQGAKTHAQQQDIIAKRVNTTNGAKDFDIRADLDRSEEAKGAYQRGAGLEPTKTDHADADDRSITRGENQRSRHEKHRADD